MDLNYLLLASIIVFALIFILFIIILVTKNQKIKNLLLNVMLVLSLSSSFGFALGYVVETTEVSKVRLEKLNQCRSLIELTDDQMKTLKSELQRKKTRDYIVKKILIECEAEYIKQYKETFIRNIYK